MQINNSNLLQVYWQLEDKLIKGNSSIKVTYNMILITKLRENINNFNRIKDLVRIYKDNLIELGFNTDDIFVSKLSIR